MKVSTRVLLGIVLGGVLALLFHPIATPYYLGTLRTLGRSPQVLSSPWLPENRAQVNNPSLASTAYSVLQVAIQIRARAPISKPALTKLVARIRTAIESDPENAFWYDAMSVFLDAAGDREGARRVWMQSASLKRWDDYQNQRLGILAKDLRGEFMGEMSWQASALYGFRRPDFWVLLRQFAFTTINSVGFKTNSNVEQRLSLIQHGRLLRDGCKSAIGGRIATAMIERATRDDSSETPHAPREVQRDRDQFLSILRRSPMANEAEWVEQVFNDNDSWFTVVDTTEHLEHRKDMIAMSTIVGSIPGACTIAFAISLVIWFVGYALSNFRNVYRILEMPIVPFLGIAVCSVVFWFTRLPGPALLSVGVFALFCFVPEDIRRNEPHFDNWGTFGLVVLSVPLAATILCFCLGLLTPSQLFVGTLDVDWLNVIGNSSLGGVGLILLAIAIMTAPLWGLARRYPPSRLAGRILVRLGTWLSVSFALGVLVLGPISIAVDRNLSNQLGKLAANEPGAYLSQ